MKANELMIGDWVFNKNINKPMQVYPMMFSQMFRQRPDATTEDYNIFPIPLTDEILRNNGFEYFHKNYASLSYEHPFALRLDKWPDENGLGGVWTVCEIIEIRYVHQLQHALRDCGIDKEIKINLEE